MAQLPLTLYKGDTPMNRKIFLRCTSVFLFSVFVITSLFAQSGTVQGKITDNKGEPLPGANIIVVGTSTGTSTGIDGSYQLKVSTGSQELRATLVGFHTSKKKITVQEGETVTQNFSLVEDLIGTDEVVIIGTRTQERTITDSPVPVDIIGAQEIQASGFTQTTQILRTLVPSYNAPSPAISDGSDHVRPATLRGLGPDQVLVLVNGKRRHTSALVHVNGTVGRGSTGVDLNAIPVSAIERVEVLRDGASAQYGSDAIAGVINIILKKNVGFDASASAGEYISSIDRGYTFADGNREVETGNFSSGTYNGHRWDSTTTKANFTDGKTVNLHLGYGLPLGDGKVYVSGQFSRKDPTNRTGIDPRKQGVADENNFDPLGQGQRINHIWGEAKLIDAALFVNGDYPINDKLSAYVFGGYSTREGKSAGFYRLANNSRNVPAIYPNGFLPYIETNVNDLSVSGGVKGSVSDWTYDLSETYGSNSLAYKVTNSLNTSYWTKSPTDFDAGTLKFSQATTNLDVFRAINVGREYPLNVALGAEFRIENYQIKEGQPESYLRGDSTSKAVGAQVFPGFSPTNKQDAKRSNFGVYADLEHKLTEVWQINAAGRFENYSDFGSTITGKVATKYDIVYGFAVRGAVSTGFRAPSLAQEYFSAVSTNFIQGVPFDIGTFPVNTSAAKALGAKDLKAEKSVNLSAGLTFEQENFSATIDFYKIDIKDRIVFTENFIDSSGKKNITNFLIAQGIVGAAGGRYFANAVNTATQGVDITTRYGIDLSELGKLRLTAAINFTKTEITNKDAILTPAALQSVTSIPLFGRVEQARFEVGQPRSTYNFIANYDYNDLGVLLRTVRYGEITNVQSITDLTLDQTFSAKWITDAEVSYRLFKDHVVAVGVNNIFDVYPDKVWKINSNNGIQQYSGQSPSGFNGRFVYARASVKI